MAGRKKQREGFLPLLGTLARPILLFPRGSIGSKLLEGARKKLFGGRKRRRTRRIRRKLRNG